MQPMRFIAEPGENDRTPKGMVRVTLGQPGKIPVSGCDLYPDEEIETITIEFPRASIRGIINLLESHLEQPELALNRGFRLRMIAPPIESGKDEI